MVALLFSGAEDIVYRWGEGEDHVVLICFLLLLAKFEFGAEGKAEEEDLFSASDARNIPKFFVDKSVEISLESLISQ